jgi:uncharacterized membrane protein YdfJ with MMPL/SSD domain
LQEHNEGICVAKAAGPAKEFLSITHGCPATRFAQARRAAQATGFWARWAAGLERRPVLPGLGPLALVVLIALPVLGLRLGRDDAGSDPAGSTTRLAYDLLARGFGPVISGPSQLAAAVGRAAGAAGLAGPEAVAADAARR